MQVFSSSDADYLLEFYSKKVIGKPISKTMESKIASLKKEDYGPNEFVVIAHSERFNQVLGLKGSIELVAIDLNLPSPDRVLKDRRKPVMKIEKINFTYDDNVKHDSEREKQLKDLCNEQWFEPLIEQINNEKGEVNLRLHEGSNNTLSYNGNNALKAKMVERSNIYQVPFGNLSS